MFYDKKPLYRSGHLPGKPWCVEENLWPGKFPEEIFIVEFQNSHFVVHLHLEANKTLFKKLQKLSKSFKDSSCKRSFDVGVILF